MMRFELRHLRAFIMLAEELHYRRAAERLFMTQPGLTRIIRRLEEEVEVPLFFRTTRSVALTGPGKVFLLHCRAVLEDLERAVRETRGAEEGNVGHITVAYMDFIINGALPEILRYFRRLYPNIGVDLIYMPSGVQKEAVLSNRIDIGLLIGPFRSSNVHTVPLAHNPLVVLLSDEHRLADREFISLAELADESFVFGAKPDWSAFRNIVSSLCHKHGFGPRVVQEASTSDGIFGLVAANMGITFYVSGVSNINRKGIVVKPLIDENEYVEIVAAWQNNTSSKCVRHFLDILCQYSIK